MTGGWGYGLKETMWGAIADLLKAKGKSPRLMQREDSKEWSRDALREQRAT